MPYFRSLSVLFSVCSMCACHQDQAPFSKTVTMEDDAFKGIILVEKVEKLGKYRLRMENHKTGGRDQIFTPYEVFAMETGDVNGDGHTDICLGIIKPTPFDPVLKKRLFIFQIDRDFIRPLWLGSRLTHPLETFAVLQGQGKQRVRSVERQDARQYYVNEYEWGEFGMTFVKECRRDLSYAEALKILHQ